MSLTDQELKDLTIDHKVDAIGEVCPHTLNMALAELKKAKTGEVVVEVTDHSIATKTIPAAVKMNKQAEHLGTLKESGTYTIFLKKL
ncbi:sulfurtransferase TusA family protein [Bacillus shivajii]|uniref:sulfurtransferase TusA family protein n=1 Tax=Bacillus shivajii TaxID=1983719 RepID=UPI001CF9EC83|nr:sulfurtransferase TusA family protein [Bacillus shivajii]UCZ52452.1 sulfurtransferase TusA family protein [Bacillus shivajii]